MLQLVYISTARHPITEASCVEILTASRTNNLRVDITGLLVAGQRRFLQALEGRPEAVRSTYKRIIDDPRHYACVLLSEQYVDERQFGDWAMGYSSGGGDLSDDAELASIVTSLVDPVRDANLRAHFIGFAKLQSRVA